MSKFATKAAANVFYLARSRASTCNERLSSRDGAAEESGVDRTRLTRIELDMIIPHPEEVLLLADTYNAPELLNYYCANVCPIGKRMIPQIESGQIDRVTINLLNAVDGFEDEVKRNMLRVAAGGKITADVLPILLAVRERMTRITKSFNEIWILTEKAAKGDK